MRLHGPTLKEGDVLMTNSPHAGGSYVHDHVISMEYSYRLSHLPDITIITPVFAPSPDASGKRPIIFFTASRGHHADIGGILPGSMPPTSTSLREEGAEIGSFKVVADGIFDSAGLHQRMVDEPAQWPGCSGCRNIKDVESDLKAASAFHFR